MIKKNSQIENIIELISRQKVMLNRGGAVLGLSGGLDSAVVASLAVKALGKTNVYLINLPERDSHPLHQKHARQFAEELGCKFIKHSVTGILSALGTYRLLPISLLPARSMRSKLVDYGKRKVVKKEWKEMLLARLNSENNTWEARANAYAMAKHRIRMVWIYQFAERHNLMVLGAANRTEWLTGTFSKWGIDHCADIMPIMHLYRSQVEEIADELGIPDYIRSKPADPDLLPGLADKNILLGESIAVDNILMAIEKGKSKRDLLKIYDADLVENLFLLVAFSEHMRKSPINLMHV